MEPFSTANRRHYRHLLEAAESMAKRFKTDVVILFDLRTKFADEHQGNYLEIIKYEEL
jgi:hypothetical protein